MKQVFTVSLEESTVAKIRASARRGSFRNKSHFVETAILRFLEGEQ